MRIERATYGAVDEAHGLLASSLSLELLPRQLAGRTDRPPGNLEPRVCWWPSIGCAPMGDWWVCWRSVEDPRSRRGGMVRTQVALIPLDALGELHDLRPLLELLDVDAPQADPAFLVTTAPTTQLPPGYHSLVAHLIAGSGPVIVPSVLALPDLICALWPRLWLRARQNFAARVLFDPDSGGALSRWWIVATPPEYATHWPPERCITLKDAPREASGMAMAWLMGQPQPAFDRMMKLVELPDTFGSLRSIERLVALEPALTRGDAAEDTLVFFRQAIQLAGTTGASEGLVRRAAEALARQMPRAGIEVILGLANVVTRPLEELAKAVSRWIADSLPAAQDGEAVRLLLRLEQERSAPWWLESVGTGVGAGLASPGAMWVAAMFRWWAQVPAIAAIERRLPADSSVEDALLDALPGECSKEVGMMLRGLAHVRGWSRFHGAVLASTHEPAAACAEQRRFIPDAAPGLRELCRRWSAQTVVEVAVASSEPVVVEAAALAVRGDRSLLAGVDLAVHGWRRVWLASIDRRSDPWGGIPEPTAMFHRLVDLMSEGASDARTLVEALMGTVHADLLGHPRRAQQWSRLPAQVGPVLLQRTADAWIRRMVVGALDDAPEATLVVGIQERAEAGLGLRISGATLARFLDVISPSDRHQTSRLFRRLLRPIPGDAARSLGRLIRKHGWQDIARELAGERGRYSNDLDPLLDQCASLLGFWQKFSLGRLERGEENPNEALKDFLGECFEPDSFRRWIAKGPEGGKILAEMPGVQSSLAEQIDGALRVLGRRRMIDGDFFDRLRDEFPRHVDAIVAIRRMARWGE